MTLPPGTPPTHKQLLVGRDEPILDSDLRIIDSHHHLFIRPPLRYMLDEYLADARAGHRIVASVYVETSAFARPGGPEPLRPLGEVEFANAVGSIAATGGYGDCLVCAGIVGFADMRLGDGIGELLDRALEIAPDRFRGVRQVAIDHPTEAPYRYITHPPPRGLLKAQGMRPALTQLARRGLTFDVAVFHPQLQEIIEIADTVPEVTLVINHCGHAVGMGLNEAEKKELFPEWRRLMSDLARRPNVVCKVGGMGMPFWGFGFEEREDPIGYRELAAAWRPYVETTIELFGPERCMMESNFPPDGRSGGFVPTWNALKSLTMAASDSEKRALFHDTAAKVYRLQLPTA